MKSLFQQLNTYERRELLCLLITVLIIMPLTIFNHPLFVLLTCLAFIVLILISTISYCAEAYKIRDSKNPLWLQLLLCMMKIGLIISMIFTCCQWIGADMIRYAYSMLNTICIIICICKHNTRAFFFTVVYLVFWNLIYISSPLLIGLQGMLTHKSYI